MGMVDGMLQESAHRPNGSGLTSRLQAAYIAGKPLLSVETAAENHPFGVKYRKNYSKFKIRTTKHENQAKIIKKHGNGKAQYICTFSTIMTKTSQRDTSSDPLIANRRLLGSFNDTTR